MSELKKENLTKCFSLLREFIDEAQTVNNKKGIAVLALNQLQQITAGSDDPPANPPSAPDFGPRCIDIPRADGNPEDDG